MNLFVSSILERELQLMRKRQLGAFYTPASVTRVLCDWAIRGRDDKILEPSFGGCTFIESAIARLIELGAEDPTTQLFGCDIDDGAFEHLRRISPELKNLDRFVKDDFLQTKISTFVPCQAIVGNPPYVALQQLEPERRAAVESWEKNYAKNVGRRSSIWAHFTLHALNFLEEGGRLAWVLPSAFLSAKYAVKIREELNTSFEKLAFLLLTDRVFLESGTEERIVIVMADDFRRNGAKSQVISTYADTVHDLASFAKDWDRHAWPAVNVRASKLYLGTDKSPIHSLVQSWQTLDELANVKIGAVAGDSKFLIRSLNDWQRLGIPAGDLKYLAPKSKWVNGLSLTVTDRNGHIANELRCLGLAAHEKPRASATKKLIDSYSADQLASNKTFSKRPVWHQFQDESGPDGILIFLTHRGPRLIVNTVGADASNGFYRLNMKKRAKWRLKLLALSLSTTPTQLAAEMLGHQRGSGALKLEPSDFKQLPIYFPEKSQEEITKAFKVADALYRNGEHDEARNYADQFIFSDLKSALVFLPKLSQELEDVRARRMRKKRTPNG